MLKFHLQTAPNGRNEKSRDAAQSVLLQVENFMMPIGFFCFCFCFCLLSFKGCTRAAYGGSQARGRIGAVGAGLHHSHSDTRSKLHLQPIPQLWQHRILNPLSEARDRTCVLMDASQIRFRCTTTGTPYLFLLTFLVFIMCILVSLHM